MTAAEQYTDPVCYHGEGALWDPAAGRLLFVDMFTGDVVSEQDGCTSRHHVGSFVAAVRPRRGGGYVVALEREFALTDQDLRVERVLPPLWEGHTVRFNDGGCDPQGRFYCGGAALDGVTPAGALYRLDPGGSVALVMGDIAESNGLGWSPDGAATYHVDSATQSLDALRFDAVTGTFSGRRTVARIDASDGTPDGLTVDADGNIWVALWDGHAVRCYRSDGALLDEVTLPTRRVTSCTFGGPHLDELFITTSRLDLDDPEPAAGAVFRCIPGVHGMPPAQFAG